MQTNTVFSSVDAGSRRALGLRSGDTVRVWSKIKEIDDKGKEKTRTQAFEGLVLARKHGDEAGGTFTVRRSAGGYGVERIYPLYSPMVDKIEIVKRAKVRRAKLYYIREKASKEAKRALRRVRLTPASVSGLVENAEPVTTKVEPDDLVKWVEGIGPKIGEVLAEKGINTFAKLAEADVENLKQILADNSLASHNPTTWPEQARLARDGKFDELKKLHDELKGGKRA